MKALIFLISIFLTFSMQGQTDKEITQSQIQRETVLSGTENETNFFFENYMNAIEKEKNAYRFAFEKLLRDTNRIDIEVFASPYDEKLLLYEQLLSKFSKYYDGKMSFKIYHYLGNEIENYNVNDTLTSELEEAIRQLAINSYYPEKFSDYLILKNKFTNISFYPEINKTINSKKAYKKLGIEEEQLEKLMQDDELLSVLKERHEIAENKLRAVTKRYDLWRDNLRYNRLQKDKKFL